MILATGLCTLKYLFIFNTAFVESINQSIIDNSNYRPEVLALSSLKHGSGLPVETEFDVERVKSLVRLQQQEDQVTRRLEPGDKQRQETVARILGERQELEWRARQERTDEVRGHRETALDGYIKVTFGMFIQFKGLS